MTAEDARNVATELVDQIGYASDREAGITLVGNALLAVERAAVLQTLRRWLRRLDEQNAAMDDEIQRLEGEARCRNEPTVPPLRVVPRPET